MKVIRKFWQYIKSLLKKIKKSKEEIKPKKETIVEENKKIIEEENKELNKINLKNIKFGDIIFAKRYTCEQEKLKIPEGHREGPYIVILNNKNKLICIKGAGTYPHDEYLDRYFHLSFRKYSLYKDTYFYLKTFRIVDETNFIKKIDKLNEQDKIDLKNKIKNIHSSEYNLNEEKVYINFLFNSGDIVLCDNKNYLIIDAANNNIIAILLEKTDLNQEVKFEKFTTLDYSKVVNLKNKSIKYINTVNNNILLYVLKKYKEYIENRKNSKNTQRGSIILRQNRLYKNCNLKFQHIKNLVLK